jgi:N-acetyl-beta-hexosaminidase
LLDVSQDSNKNAFSKRMQSVYTACQEDSGNGVTKRSINRIETFLSEEGKNSAFVAVARHVTARFLHTDKSRITDKVKHKIERLMDQLYASVDGVLDNKIVDEQEAAARNDMEELLPGLLHDWEQASQSLQAVKANYETLK